ncbi:magnesium transporter [Mycoplasma todarodis]|uniref:Magnesium transporter MgtE n=2 Tax=Mycoplasma todarodis TaxID=1937191 RepID=A0A4R0XU65_9MOLU|nr:magnesium transporter [Mycoplasma todarodis]
MTLRTALKTKKVPEIRKIVKETTVADLADMVEELHAEERKLLFRVLDSDQSGKLFSNLDIEFQEKIIEEFSDVQQKEILSTIYADDIADMIEEMPSNIAKQILKNTPKDRRTDVNKLLRYEDHQTGSIMSTDVVEIKQSLTPTQAIKIIKTEHAHTEDMLTYFVVNQKGKLVGEIDLHQLVFATKGKKVKDIMGPVASVSTTMDKEEAALEFAKHDAVAMPVVNTQGYLMGMITSDDVIDTIQEEATEDMHRMAGIEGVESSYLKTSIFKLFKSRVFWLLLLMISSTLSQIVLDSFMKIAASSLHETTGQAATAVITSALIAIVPVISGAAGNAGSQASTMVTRGIALGEIKKDSTFSVVRKEFGTGAMVGGILAIANFARLLIYYGVQRSGGGSMLLSQPSPNTHSYAYVWISFAASLSLFIVIIFAKMVGGLLPLLAHKMKLDPAVMAAPLLTTLIDALSILIFFGISIGILLLTVV